MHPTGRSRALAAATAVSLLAVGGCSHKSPSPNEQATSSEPSGQTLAEAIAAKPDLSTVSAALRDTGLSQVFDDSGAYTILAPTNAAFGKLGAAGKALLDANERSELAAVLRDHIVPGYLTPADIANAIDAQRGEARVRTMGDHILKFSRAGDGLRVTAEDGSEAMIAGDALQASDGVAIPIDGVLKNLNPAG